MSSKRFSRHVAETLLVKSHRRCCLCHKFCGSNIEIHHIDPMKGNAEDNGIPLCFDCHAKVRAYDPTHPKGRMFTPSELKKHRDQWFELMLVSPWTPQDETFSEVDMKTPLNINHPLHGQNVNLGIMTPTTEKLKTTKALLQIVNKDLNKYVEKIGYDIKFSFVLKSNEGNVQKPLENIKVFHEMGINLIIGDIWSSQCNAILSYINKNDMILINSASTSPLLSIAGDNLFRTCPNDFVQATALINMWASWGIEAILIFQRADAWGDALTKLLSIELRERNIVELGKIRYNGDTTDFNSYLQSANDIISNAKREFHVNTIGLQFFSFGELRTIQTQASAFTNLMNLLWMTTESGGRSPRMLADAGDWATKTKHFSPLMNIIPNSKWSDFEREYVDINGYYPSFYDAAFYDAVWIMALSILQTGRTNFGPIKSVLSDVAGKHFGLTGWCNFDETGDRTPQSFNIWGFYKDPLTHENWFKVFGIFDGIQNEVFWDYYMLKKYANLVPPKYVKMNE